MEQVNLWIIFAIVAVAALAAIVVLIVLMVKKNKETSLHAYQAEQEAQLKVRQAEQKAEAAKRAANAQIQARHEAEEAKEKAENAAGEAQAAAWAALHKDDKVPETKTVTLTRMGYADDMTYHIRFTGSVTIGRGPAEPGFAIPEDIRLSKTHCTIRVEDGKMWIRDEKSTNGTFLNGVPVTGEETMLNSDDRLLIGFYEYRVTGE